MAQSISAINKKREKKERKARLQRIRMMRNLGFLVLGAAAVAAGIYFLAGARAEGVGLASPFLSPHCQSCCAGGKQQHRTWLGHLSRRGSHGGKCSHRRMCCFVGISKQDEVAYVVVQVAIKIAQ